MLLCRSRARRGSRKGQAALDYCYPPSPTPERPVPPPAAHFLVRDFSGCKLCVKAKKESVPCDAPASKLRSRGRTEILKNRACVEKRKRGPVQAPLFIIDAPKPVTESRIGSGHPGKPIFVRGVRRSKSDARGFASAPIFGRLLKAQGLDKKVTRKHGFSIGKAYKIPQEAPNFLQSLGAGGSRTGSGGDRHSDSARRP